VYARRDLPEGHILTDEDVYLAIPLQKGQISCRELMRGEVLMSPIRADQPVMIDNIDTPYASIPSLRELLYGRGLEAIAGAVNAQAKTSGTPARPVVSAVN
jgi:N-acetylneuraminate synthase